MTRDKVYFLSDLHLGAAYLGNSREIERHVVRFLDSIKDSAKAIYLLGDILDYWYEYKYVVPRGYVRFFGKLAELADSGIAITWLLGNHDIWIFDYIPNEIGVRVVDGNLVEEIQGKRVLMAHGDRIGHPPRMFRFIQSLFRNKVCQFLFSGIHPRWTVPFAYRWSGSSRSDEAKAITGDTTKVLDELAAVCRDMAKEYPAVDYFIFGHYHIVGRRKIDDRSELLMMGDWLTHFTYGVMEHGEIQINNYAF